MNNEIIDQVIAESASAPTADQPETTSKTEEETTAPETEPQEPVKEKEEDVPFPKKAVNAISYRDKKIGKLQAELAALKAEKEALQAPKQSTENKPKSDGPPSEEDYDNYGEFMKAQLRWEMKQELQNAQKLQDDQRNQAQQAEWRAERESAQEYNIEEAIKTVPDFQSILAQNVELLDAMPPHVEMAFLESDNAALAGYALLKEGKLQSLFTMSPARAAMEIGRAQDRAEAMLKAKPVTKAPQPMAPAKGVGGVKSREAQTPDELMAWFRS